MKFKLLLFTSSFLYVFIGCQEEPLEKNQVQADTTISLEEMLINSPFHKRIIAEKELPKTAHFVKYLEQSAVTKGKNKGEILNRSDC